ncbi:maternal B9.10 protein-like [Sinocyclocheilus rhinocerous]|uniref:Maternal B9.10 protein-like n=1 Tax=Sinocyclocheilus rhinocerous TaxID=307959 RepID=A0A673N023_9TELE|nr:PREDICTED: maternal B9.10 protein-like [Sinocyclocheilus rhinocerous]
MKEEIAATVFFIARLAKKHGKLDHVRREKFAVELTSVLFENYKNHWYPENPTKGQAFRCLRMNKAQTRDPVIECACRQSDIVYENLGLPKEMTIWVDPGEVSCRYGEKSTPICVTQLVGQKRDGEFSRRINNAVERASSDYHSGTSSDEEGGNTSMSTSMSSSISSSNCSSLSVPEPKCIPTVSNPNSVYQLSEFGQPPPMQNWGTYPKRKPYASEGYQQHSSSGPYPPHKSFKGYRPSYAFSGPRVDRYHWVSKNRS